VKYAFIDEQRQSHRIQKLCQTLEVSPSGFYEWQRREESPRSQQQRCLTQKIRVIHASHRGVYGSPRVHRVLVKSGETVCVNTVAKLMQKADIKAKPCRRYKVTTESRQGFKVSPNHLGRQFLPKAPVQSWATDVTFVPTRQGPIYLAVVMELHSRRIIGWAMDNKNTANLVCSATRMAIDGRKNLNGLTLHSDQGIQYIANEYQDLLKQYGIRCSMSRKGNCWDNAVVESFFHTLKSELDLFECFSSRSEARMQIFEYIECFYNRSRLHSTLGYMSPADYEMMHCAA
jgi:transposase InsO family protein